MALPDGTEVDAPSSEPRLDTAPAGRRFRTSVGLAAYLDREVARFRQVIANLRANPPADESADLDRITIAADGVHGAVTTLDRALGWREGR